MGITESGYGGDNLPVGGHEGKASLACLRPAATADACHGPRSPPSRWPPIPNGMVPVSFRLAGGLLQTTRPPTPTRVKARRCRRGRLTRPSLECVVPRSREPTPGPSSVPDAKPTPPFSRRLFTAAPNRIDRPSLRFPPPLQNHQNTHYRRHQIQGCCLPAQCVSNLYTFMGIVCIWCGWHVRKWLFTGVELPYQLGKQPPGRCPRLVSTKHRVRMQGTTAR